LYADYLDQNQYVFIDFFVPGCQPCQILAPKVDTVFREFGCNNGDIAFLGIEVYSYDSVLWNFVREYHVGFPAASGNEGGGHAVYDTFGYIYTPYKIIIDPNGKIVSDNPDVPTALKLRDSLLKMELTMQPCSGNDFLFYAANSKEDSIRGEIDYESNIVNILMPSGTDLTSIRPTFVNAPNSIIEVDGEVQISGETILDFSQGSIVYTITSEQGVSRQWTVNIMFIQTIRDFENLFSIYPTLTNGNVYIETDAPHLLPYRYSLRNITGQEVLTGSISKPLDNVDLFKLGRGLYYLTLFNTDFRYTQKIVIN
jgi:hypothetical protein